MTHALRRFETKDVEGAKGLILGILAKEYPFDKSAYSDSDLDHIAKTYGGRREVFFVVEENGSVVGTTGIKEESKEEALLRRVFVDPNRRKRGYGTSLLDEAIHFCIESGYKRVYFRCTDRMSGAMSLCKKKGFKEVEELEVSGFKIHKLKLEL